MEEIWKDIKGYEGKYQISNFGKVKSLSRKLWNGHAWWTSKERILMPRTSKKVYHYLSVQLVDDKGKKKNINIHRIVAEHFLENKENLLYVNHINEDKHDNRASNLEWCSPSYNANYGNMKEVNANKRKLIHFEDVTNGDTFVLDEKKEYEELGFSRKAVRIAIQRGKKYHKYKVKYIER